MEITILVTSSSQPVPRSVQVTHDDSSLSFYCDCPAGKRIRLCKHKKAVASGDDSMLYDEGQRDKFEKVMTWVAESGYPDLMKALQEADNELESARVKVEDIREKVIFAMKEGLK
jgi:hypothetical protein